MQRILIIGNAGSGKSTLAAHVGEALGLPVFGLDSIVWQPHWQKRDAKSRAVMEAELLARPQWIIDGVSKAAFAAADFVIFLDVNRRTCLLRCLNRNRHFLFSSRPGLPTHCPEILIIPTLIRLIMRFPHDVRPWILAALRQRPNSSLVFQRERRPESVLAAALQELSAP